MLRSTLVESALKQLLADHVGIVARNTALARALDRAQAVDADAAAHLTKMKEESEPFRRLPKSELDRVLAELRHERRSVRTLAAGVERYHVEPAIEPFERRVRELERQARRDPSRSLPEDRGLDADPYLVAQVEESVRANRLPELRAASPAQRMRA